MTGKQGTAVVSLVAASALVALKLGTGLATGSLGLVSAGIESSGDVIAAALTFLAIRLAGKPPDERHQYGHARAENLAALGEASILAGGGIYIVHEAHHRLTVGGGHEVTASWPVFAVLALSIVIDVSRTSTSLRTARRYNSAALRSNAFHFGADLAGTVSVLIGMLFVRAGYVSADAIASLFVAALIFVTAARLVTENARSLMDAAPAGADAAARAAIAALDESVELRRLRVRESGGRHFADVVVAVPETSALGESHARAEAIERAVNEALPGSDVVVHVEPAVGGRTETEAALGAALAVAGVREVHNVTVVHTEDGTIVSLHVKVPADLTLAEGARLETTLRDAIRNRVSAVTTLKIHLEPFEEPLTGHDLPPARESDLRHAIASAVAKMIGRQPTDIRLVATDEGVLAFVTIVLDAATPIRESHRLSSEIEADIHRLCPDVRQVVVETVAA